MFKSCGFTTEQVLFGLAWIPHKRCTWGVGKAGVGKAMVKMSTIEVENNWNNRSWKQLEHFAL